MSKGQSDKYTYHDAGVDIHTADDVVKIAKGKARKTFSPSVLSDIGVFGGLFELKGYDEPVLVSSADGVGTKAKIASAMGKHESIGIDIVNHCVNDIFTCGAKPLFFLDYVAMAKLDKDIISSLLEGMSAALQDTGCALIGGETAEMPGVYPPGEFDLVGFIVGVVEKRDIIDISKIVAGDALIGLPSSGLHTNGFSLVRHIFKTDADPNILNVEFSEIASTFGEALLKPHRCYFNSLNPLIDRIKGMAHITGGGIPGNLPRSLPDSLGAVIKKDSWDIPPLFKLIQKRGNVEELEMYSVFNMGIGMIAISSRHHTSDFLNIPGARLIGEVVNSEGKRIDIV